MQPTDELKPPARAVGLSALLTALLTAFVLLALVVGTAQVRLVASLVGAALALLLAARLVRAPLVVLTIAVATGISGVSDALGAIGVPKFFLVVLALAIAASAKAVRSGAARLRWSPIYAAGTVWLGTQALSALGAPYPALALSNLKDYAFGAAFVVCIATLASVDRGPSVAVRAAVVTIGALAALTVVHQMMGNGGTFAGLSIISDPPEAGGIPRHAGPLTDANFWGRDLALVLPLALWLGAAASSLRWRLAWWLLALMIAAGLFLSGSRGAFIATVAALLVWLIATGRKHRRLVWSLPAVLAPLALLPGVPARLAELTQIGTVLQGGGDPSLVGRVAALRYGIEMTLDHPIAGVGPGNFAAVVAQLQQEDGSTAARALAAHNTYLQVAAESGFAGLAAWLLFVATVLLVVVRVIVISESDLGSGSRAPRARPVRGRLDFTRPDAATQAYAASLLAAVVAWFVASVFLHLAELPALAVVVGLIVALDQSVQRPPAPPSDDRTQTAGPAPAVVRRSLVAGAVALLAAEAILLPASAIAAPAATTTWRASLSLNVTPSKADADAYDVSLASRQFIVATYAELALLAPAARGAAVSGPGITLSVLPSANSTLVELAAVADSADAASAAVLARETSVNAYLTTQKSFFQLEPSGAPLIERVHSSLARLSVVVGGQLVCLLVGYVVASRVRRGGRRPREPAQRSARVRNAGQARG